jgi:hypothetical protein
MKAIAGAGLVVACLGLAPPAIAQGSTVVLAAPAAAAARAADVASVDAIVAALYEVVSGPAGKVRDWNRLRSLFTADGKLGAIGARKEGGFGLRAMTVDDYIARTSKPFSEAGFFETELARRSEQFGQLTHVFSTYEARKAPGDATPFMRGVNSLQLFHDGTRWWIVSLLWRAEDDQLGLPDKYLKRP